MKYLNVERKLYFVEANTKIKNIEGKGTWPKIPQNPEYLYFHFSSTGSLTIVISCP
jgi:hypothetical protein